MRLGKKIWDMIKAFFVSFTLLNQSNIFFIKKKKNLIAILFGFVHTKHHFGPKVKGWRSPNQKKEDLLELWERR